MAMIEEPDQFDPLLTPEKLIAYYNACRPEQCATAKPLRGATKVMALKALKRKTGTPDGDTPGT